LRDHYRDGLAIPLRYITRPKRKNDDLVENQPVALNAFQDFIKQGRIDVWWQRPMEGSRVEHYGFAAVSRPEKLKIYSANNAIVRDKNAKLEKLGNYKILAMKAEHAVRADRLSKRSPDLSPAEIEYRLGDDASDVIQKADYVIDNSNITLKQAELLSQEIIDSLI
jgi:ribose 1,5-bisphosphokinase PhnN